MENFELGVIVKPEMSNLKSENIFGPAAQHVGSKTGKLTASLG